MRAIHNNGGLVIVQEPESAEFDGMPRSAIALGIADYVLKPELMAQAVQAYTVDPNARLNYGQHGGDQPAASANQEFDGIFRSLQAACGIDFSHYKIATVDRRIRRRMALHECVQVSEYANLVHLHPEEADLLYRDLLIGVTEFFRDPKVYVALRENVLRPLLKNKDRDEVRVWVSACATGEEVYSVAMLIDEVAREHAYVGRISIFATDVHRSSLAHAAAGIYQPAQLLRLSEQQRAEYFIRENDGSMRVTPILRQRIVFAPHNLLSDPPFTKLDLVTCRNLLIYLTPSAQERALGMFHYALRPEGSILLGLSEGLGRLEPEFQAIDSKLKIFRKFRESRIPISMTSRPILESRPAISVAPHSTLINRSLLSAYDYLLGKHVPPGFIINETGELVHTFGNASIYLLPQQGRMEPGLMNRCEGPLFLALSAVYPRVFRSEEPVTVREVTLTVECVKVVVDVSAELVVGKSTQGRMAFIRISTQDQRTTLAQGTPPAVGAVVEDSTRERIETLELELQSSRQNLQATVEELQTTNEELQASNEEMVASNEELQATNEELHSVNEELHSVNAELEERNQEQRALNEDLDNLFSSLEAGVLFIDKDLRIRKFNKPIEKIFSLLPQDIGRPVDHISYQFAAQDDITKEAKQVLSTGKSIEKERRTREGAWLMKRLLPYYSSNRSIAGVVITFTDITNSKVMQERIELAMEASKLVWWEWDIPSDRLVTHTVGWCILGYELGYLEPTSNTWYKLTHPDEVAQVKASLEACLRGESSSWSCEHRYKTRQGGWLWVHEAGRITERGADGRPLRMLGTTQDIQARKIAEQTLARDSHILACLQDAVVATDMDGSVEYWGGAAQKLFQTDAPSAIGKPLSEVMPAEVRDKLSKPIQTLPAGSEFSVDWTLGDQHLDTRVVRMASEGMLGGSMIAITRDISSRVSKEKQLLETQQQLLQSQKMETLGVLAGGIAHDFNNLLTAILGSTSILIEDVGDRKGVSEHLQNIQSASEQAASLVGQILAFSHSGPHSHEKVVMEDFLKEIHPLLRAIAPSTITLDFRLSASNRVALMDRNRIQQVILNLCTNAIHSIGQKPGVLTVHLSVAHIEQTEVCAVSQLTPGHYLKLTVGDNGQGIPADVLPRIFEPFFTTKKLGEGTGLGLSIVHGVILSHRGAVKVKSQAGKGCTFEVFLPCLEQESHPAPAVQSKTVDGTGQRIAVVDDENRVAMTIRIFLSKHGYEAESFDSAIECLHRIKKPETGRFDLIITDQTMPEMTGWEFAKKLRHEGDKTPIILTSGFSEEQMVDASHKLNDVAFVSKPYQHGKLLELMAQMLKSSKGLS